jgi:pyruvate/2-oxoglutarate dehydrogenase complex dihydrolipoamide acyltransferase (E2) component
MADLATGKVISEMTAEKYVLFTAPAEGGIFYAVGQTGDVLAIGDRAAVQAREAEKEAAKRAAPTAPAVAPSPSPTAPATAPTTAPAEAPTAPAEAPATAPTAPAAAPQ